MFGKASNLAAAVWTRIAFLSTLLLLPYCCQQLDPQVMACEHYSLITCKQAHFRSGAEGIRTPDLRRAKAESHHRSRSRLFKNTCKTANSRLCSFAVVRSRSRGLVYYWCSR